MDEIIRYIFGSLRYSETALRVMSKTLKKQRSFNRSVAWFAIIVTAENIVREMQIRNMYSKIEALQKEIKELKNTEGD